MRKVGDDAQRIQGRDGFEAELCEAARGSFDAAAAERIVVVMCDLKDAKSEFAQQIDAAKLRAYDLAAALDLKEYRRLLFPEGISYRRPLCRQKDVGHRAQTLPGLDHLARGRLESPLPLWAAVRGRHLLNSRHIRDNGGQSGRTDVIWLSDDVEGQAVHEREGSLGGRRLGRNRTRRQQRSGLKKVSASQHLLYLKV